jgi:hypothetical protein
MTPPNDALRQPRRKHFYVVFCNGKPGEWRSRLFDDTIAGPLVYQTRKGANDAASKAKQLYGWSKVVRCEVTVP